MGGSVGPKGQVVIEKEIRDQLGVETGWQTVQVPAEDHVKIFFVPPPHRRSLRGSLARYSTRSARTEADWDEARASAWTEAASGRFGEVQDE